MSVICGRGELRIKRAGQLFCLDLVQKRLCDHMG
jgi:hypothetical protein